MSTAEVAANKAAFQRFHDAANTGDIAVISKTIDELVEPDAVVRTPLPIGANGGVVDVYAQMKQIGVIPA